MAESTNSEQEYPDELLDAHRIEDSRLYVPSDFVIEGLKELMFEMEIFEETGDAYNMARMQVYGEYLGTMSQEELYQEMKYHSNSTVSSAAKHLNPEHKPRTESTFEYILYLTQEIAPQTFDVK